MDSVTIYNVCYIQCLLKTQFGESHAGEVNSELVHKLQITVRVVVGGMNCVLSGAKLITEHRTLVLRCVSDV